MDIAFDSLTGEPLGWTVEAYVLHCRVLRSPAREGLSWFLTLEECTHGADTEPSVVPVATPVGAPGTALSAVVLCTTDPMARSATPHRLHALLGCVRPDGTARACETSTFLFVPPRGRSGAPHRIEIGRTLVLEVVRVESLAPPCMAHTLDLVARAGWDAHVQGIEEEGIPRTGMLGVHVADGGGGGDACGNCAWYHLADLAAVPSLDLEPTDQSKKHIEAMRQRLGGTPSATAPAAAPLGDLAHRLGHAALQAAAPFLCDVRVHLHADQTVCPPRRLCVPLDTAGRRAAPVVSLATARAAVAQRLVDLTRRLVVLDRPTLTAPQCLVFRYANAAQQDGLRGLPLACVVLRVSSDTDGDAVGDHMDVLAPTGVDETLDSLLRQQRERMDIHTLLMKNDE